MFFGNHTTTKAERDALIERQKTDEYELSHQITTINPQDFHSFGENKPIVWEEGTDLWYSHADSLYEFFGILDRLKRGDNFDLLDTAYYRRWEKKGQEIRTRLGNLPRLFHDIRMKGVEEPVHAEVTGQRLDGSYRTKIAYYLGHKTVPAILHQWNRKNVTDDLLQRLLKGRWLSGGKEYYEFEYPNGWKNIPEGGAVYRENAERADVILPLIKGDTLLDIGCNEGYLSIRAAMQGKKVHGIDINYIHGANLNKLIFEYCLQKSFALDFSYMNAVTDLPQYKHHSVLLLCVLYHMKHPIKLLRKLKGSQLIIQCNLRKKEAETEYYGSQPHQVIEMLKMAGFTVQRQINWRDKPIIIAV